MRKTTRGLAAGVAALLMALVAQACSSGGNQPPTVTLAQLSAQQESYAGKQVATSGRVQEFTDSGGSYYVLTDDADNRVALEPTEDAASYAGKEVSVTGTFEFSPDSGRRIQVDTITPVGVGAPGATGTPAASDVAQPGRDLFGA